MEQGVSPDEHGSAGHRSKADPAGFDAQLLVRMTPIDSRGLKFFSKLRRERLTAIANRLAESEYDLIGLQEIWVESEDWTYMRTVCKEVYPYGQFFFTYVTG